MVKRIILSSAAAILLLLFYLLFWPVPIDPAAWDPPDMPPPIGVYAENDRLCAAERMGKGAGLGPEDIAFDERGALYAGMADGRIVRFAPGGSNPHVVANTGGRPLGLAFDARGRLVVADAFKGLLSIAPDGTIQMLAEEAGGRRLNFADGLAVAAGGTIFFTEASTRFSQDRFALDMYEHRPNGRLLAYDPGTHSTRVLRDGLYFANGVALSPDESFLLVAETSRYRVQRFWVQGPRQGQAEVFVENLPGMPDNIHWNGVGAFWVGIPTGPAGRRAIDSVLPIPFVRSVLLRLPEALRPAPPRSGYVLAFDLDGNVRQTLQDPEGRCYAEITTAYEHEGMLYLGSSTEDGWARLPLP